MFCVLDFCVLRFISLGMYTCQLETDIWMITVVTVLEIREYGASLTAKY